MQRLLADATQSYPPVREEPIPDFEPAHLENVAIVFTAGGDGERLRESLLKSGAASREALGDFTKATWHLQGLKCGTLELDLRVLAASIKRHSLKNIVVIVTTGPPGSVTHRVIPELLAQQDNFGLGDSLMVVSQGERLHFSNDGKIVWRRDPGGLKVMTQPDESGGPLMAMNSPPLGQSGDSVLSRMRSRGIEALMLLQGTSVYRTGVVEKIASALATARTRGVQLIGSGQLRPFMEGKDWSKDKGGTYVEVRPGFRGEKEVHILESFERTEASLKVTDEKSAYFAPNNTGYYGFDLKLLDGLALPDYATDPKGFDGLEGEVEKAVKVGYAATHVLPLASTYELICLEDTDCVALKDEKNLVTIGETLLKDPSAFGLGELIGSLRQ